MALLLHGDCLEMMKTLPSKSIDCFICDLPYGCLSGRAIGKNAEAKKCWSGDAMGCAWDVKIDLGEFWKQVKRLARNDNTPCLMFCTTKFGAELISSNPEWYRYDLVWSKSNGVGFLSANKQPLRSHEMIYVFSKKGANYKRIDVEVEGAKEYIDNRVETRTSIYGTKQVNPHKSLEGIRCVKSVIEISNKKAKGNHPTQKPAELYKWLLERYCPPNGTMLDPTAGSFNSVFTARELGLHAIGIEKDDKFFWKAVGTIA